ncbi:MAG: 30S ribosomal protein S17 [Dehalococcoidia bacterium]|nr:30S ribosomal protein S17 [Dehalococcoidia bacterium]
MATEAEVVHKIRVGRVISDKMQKTRIVAIKWKQHHPKYKRLVSKETRFKVHDEKNESKLGDLVRIIEGRPLSKEKHWRVAEILERGMVANIKPVEIEESTLVELSTKQRPEIKKEEPKDATQ